MAQARAAKGGQGGRGKGEGGRGSGKPEGKGDVGLDHLFQLPLNEFTPARNALATKLKKAGRPDEAEQLRGLSRPPVSAWVVNQLHWRHHKAFEELLATGARFTEAQAAQLAGTAADIRGPLDARRKALSALTRLAASVLTHSDHSLTPDTMRRITTTLEALATYGTHPDAPRAGRLTGDIDPPGFEALAALVPRMDREPGKKDEPSRVLPFRQQEVSRRKKKQSPEDAARERDEERRAQQAAAKAAVLDAERGLKEAKKVAERAEAALKTIAGRTRESDRERLEAEARFEKAAAAADALKQEARRIASEAEDAAQAVADAERALEKAQAALE